MGLFLFQRNGIDEIFKSMGVDEIITGGQTIRSFDEKVF